MIEIRKKPMIRVTGTVISRNGRQHTVNSDDGRVLIVDSYTPYIVGARVTIVADAIISSAGASPKIKNFQQ